VDGAATVGVEIEGTVLVAEMVDDAETEGSAVIEGVITKGDFA
jgi:hypothetical protein